MLIQTRGHPMPSQIVLVATRHSKPICYNIKSSGYCAHNVVFANKKFISIFWSQDFGFGTFLIIKFVEIGVFVCFR